MKALLWALKHLFRGFYGIEKSLEDLVRCQKRLVELNEMAILLQYGGKKPSMLALGGSEPGDESFHWTPESEEVRREVYKKAYEGVTGRTLAEGEPIPGYFLEEIKKLEDESPIV